MGALAFCKKPLLWKTINTNSHIPISKTLMKLEIGNTYLLIYHSQQGVT
jgi:hypothetical protein